MLFLAASAAAVRFAATATVRRFSMTAATTAAARGFECPRLLCVLPLERLHLLRVLFLQILLAREALLLDALQRSCVLASERLGLILMPLQHRSRLLLVTLLFAFPVGVGFFVLGLLRSRRLTLLFLLRMLTLEGLRFGVVLLLKLSQLSSIVALEILLLLGPSPLQVLQIDVVLALERLLLHGVLAFY
jgi:hypothetical protein